MQSPLRSTVLSLLCATPAFASAQSTVLLGGMLKLGLDITSTSGSDRVGGTSSSASRESNNTSFWFIDGQEKLGAGMRTVYHLEWDFAADTGVQGPGRIFYLGLDHERFGSLKLGRQAVYFSHHWFINDSHGAFDAAPNAANSLNVLGTINGAHFAGNFLNNTVRYDFPIVAGFYGSASYSFDGKQPGMGRSHTWYISPTYKKGNLKIGYFHMQRNSQGLLPLQTAGSLDQTGDKLAIGYTWDSLRFGLVVDRNRVTDRAANTSQERFAYAIPLNYGFGQHLLSLTWGQALSMRENGNAVPDTGAKMLSLSYQYSLSRRTMLALSHVALHNDRNGRYNFWLGGLYNSQLGLADAGARVCMLYAGIMHLF